MSFLPQEPDLLSTALRIILAVLLGGAIGLERGRHGRAAGLRTHVLVCVGAAMAAMTGIFLLHTNGAGDPSRIASNVVSGIGFLGAGIIIVKNNSTITGLTTAAALWATSTVGLAVGAGYYLCAIIGTAVIFVTTTFLTVFEVKQKRDVRFYIEITDVSLVNETVEAIRAAYPLAHSFDIFPAKSGIAGNIAIFVNISTEEKSAAEIVKNLRDNPNTVIAIEE
ncbi:MAG: MgtC/SapB family protein [Clostridia bacterium]|nr:MgtC/SapB family protein [Clostridia bacterium]